jgi:glycosyltransferase involved in cell wall biosynthesis
MTATAVVVNARCLRRRITGVERYAHALVRRLGDKLRAAGPARSLEGLRGHYWEQVKLPRLVHDGELLWSPANTGPLAVKKQVVTIHDLSVLDHPEWFDRRVAFWYGYLLPRLARQARRVITDSVFSQQRLLDRLRLKEDSTVVVPCGVDGRFHPASEAETTAVLREYGVHGPYLFTVGSLEPRKNLGVLFAAWQRIRPRLRGVELVVAGAGRSSFRGTGFRMPPPGVRMLGFVGDDHLPALYQRSLACLLVSLYEGFGLTLLEAAACGAPVVGSDIPALRETIGDAMLMVNPVDTESVAAGLVRIVEESDLRAQLRSCGLARARQLTWERTADLTWQVLQEAAAA